jgi:hypothetical protein
VRKRSTTYVFLSNKDDVMLGKATAVRKRPVVWMSLHLPSCLSNTTAAQNYGRPSDIEKRNKLKEEALSFTPRLLTPWSHGKDRWRQCVTPQKRQYFLISGFRIIGRASVGVCTSFTRFFSEPPSSSRLLLVRLHAKLRAATKSHAVWYACRVLLMSTSIHTRGRVGSAMVTFN